MTKKNGDTYYIYILTYVDDFPVVHKDPKWAIDIMRKKRYNYMSKNMGPPEKYPEDVVESIQLFISKHDTCQQEYTCKERQPRWIKSWEI